MVYTPPAASGLNGSGSGNGQKGRRVSAPVITKTKAVSYNSTTSDSIFELGSDASATSKEAIPGAVRFHNPSRFPVELMLGYQEYSDDTSVSGSTEFLHTMLPAGATIDPPIQAVIRTGESSAIMDGTVIDSATPDTNMYVDSTANVDTATSGDMATSSSITRLYLEPYTSATNCTANLFYVGDLIRVENEIMEVTAIGDKSNLANNYLTVRRGQHGSTPATHADAVAVRYPFFNAHHDFDTYTKVQTDRSGKYKSTDFVGLGRSATEVQGVQKGSVAIMFWNSGYQCLGMSGITSSTQSGLTADTEYGFDITANGSGLVTSDTMKFTTDTANTTFGGTDGIVKKINSVLETLFYTTGSNLLNEKVTCRIQDGDIKFYSEDHTSASAILLAAPSAGETTPFGVGVIPAIGSVRSPIPALLPDEVIYDRNTYLTSPNTGAFLYDDGEGNLFGAGTGTINYETGALSMRGCPSNAEFVVSCLHSNWASGKLTESETNRINCLVKVLANCPNQKGNASIDISVFPPGRIPPPYIPDVNPRIVEMP